MDVSMTLLIHQPASDVSVVQSRNYARDHTEMWFTQFQKSIWIGNIKIWNCILVKLNTTKTSSCVLRFPPQTSRSLTSGWVIVSMCWCEFKDAGWISVWVLLFKLIFFLYHLMLCSNKALWIQVDGCLVPTNHVIKVVVARKNGRTKGSGKLLCHLAADITRLAN